MSGDGGEIPLGEQPAVRIRLAAERWGEPDLITRCVTLLRTGSLADDPDLVLYLGGRHGRRLVEYGLGREGYWLRVWPLRAMLYAWHGPAEPAVVGALDDEHWRVREMALKVAVKRQIGAASDAAAQLDADPVTRVRIAVARALGAVGEGEHAAALRGLLADSDGAVRARAEQALAQLAVRLDRPL